MESGGCPAAFAWYPTCAMCRGRPGLCLKGGGGAPPPPPNAPPSSLSAHNPNTSSPPPAFPTASECPPTDCTARPNRFVTALPPERPPPQANPWGRPRDVITTRQSRKQNDQHRPWRVFAGSGTMRWCMYRVVFALPLMGEGGTRRDLLQQTERKVQIPKPANPTDRPMAGQMETGSEREWRCRALFSRVVRFPGLLVYTTTPGQSSHDHRVALYCSSVASASCSVFGG